MTHALHIPNICPACGGRMDTVDSRPVGYSKRKTGYASIRRRRECQKCGHRITTYEFVFPTEWEDFQTLLTDAEIGRRVQITVNQLTNRERP